MAAQILGVLEPLLGRHTAKNALALVCKRLDRREDELSAADLDRIHETLGPILRTLVGREVAGRVLAGFSASRALADS